MPKKKVLISGHDGFTGKYLFNSLLRSNDYLPIGLNVDIRNYGAVSERIKSTQPDIFVNLAAISIIKNYSFDFYCETNSFPIINIINSLSQLQNNPKIIIISSGNSYISESICDENCKRLLLNNYSKSKDLLEKIVIESKYENFLILRPFNYTGYGQSKNFFLPKVVDCLMNKDDVLYLGALDTIREFNDINLIVKIYELLFRYNGSEKIINIGSGVGYKLEELLSNCFDFFKHYPKIETKTKFKRNNEQIKLICDNTRLIKILESYNANIKWPTKKNNLENILNNFKYSA